MRRIVAIPLGCLVCWFAGGIGIRTTFPMEPYWHRLVVAILLGLIGNAICIWGGEK